MTFEYLVNKCMHLLLPTLKHRSNVGVKSSLRNQKNHLHEAINCQKCQN